MRTNLKNRSRSSEYPKQAILPVWPGRHNRDQGLLRVRLTQRELAVGDGLVQEWLSVHQLCDSGEG